MSSHPFDTLTLENGAKLIFTPCPGTKQESLEESIKTLKQAGTNMLLTLMFDEEIERNNVTQMPSICETNSIDWRQLPILDDEAPSDAFEANWQAYKTDILAVVNKQGTIAVHCKGGTGRTGLVIALILLAYGWPVEKIMTEVQKIRPKTLRNPLQLNYFKSYC